MARDTRAALIEAAAQRLRDAQHVATVIGGRAALKELADAQAAMSQAAGVRRR